MRVHTVTGPGWNNRCLSEKAVDHGEKSLGLETGTFAVQGNYYLKGCRNLTIFRVDTKARFSCRRLEPPLWLGEHLQPRTSTALRFQ
jgi:hypothetical protein